MSYLRSGPEHIELADTLTELGIAHSQLGDCSKMIERSQQALHITVQHYGLQHWRVADALHSLGYFYGVLGDNIKMIELSQQALQIQAPGTPLRAGALVCGKDS